jgi:O-antigen/teichoic acid export membrane protein
LTRSDDAMARREENRDPFSRELADQSLLHVTKQTSGVMSSRMIGVVLGFVSNVVFARVLGAEFLGVFVLASTSLLFVSLVASFGMGHTFVRFVPVLLSRGDRPGAASLFGLGARLVLVSSLVFGALVYLLRGVIAGRVFDEPLLTPIMPIVAVGVVGATFELVLGHTLRSLKSPSRETFCLEVVDKVTKLAVFAVLAYFGLRLSGITIAMLAGYFAAVGAMLFMIDRQAPYLLRGPRMRSVPTREIFAFSSVMLFVGFMNYSLSISDRVMLGILGTSTDVGIYNIAFLISNMLTLVFMGFNASFAPVISELYHNDRIGELKSLYSSLTRGILIIIVPAFCWLVGFGDDLLTVFGGEFSAGYAALIVLSVGVVARCAVGTVGTMLVMSGHQRYNAANIIIVTAMNVVLNLLLIPRYGLLGAAVATAVSVSAIDTVGLIEVRLLLGIHPYRPAYLKILIAAVVALAGNLLLRAILPSLPPLAIAALLIATYAVFLGLVFLMGLEHEDRLLIGRGLARLRGARE